MKKFRQMINEKSTTELEDCLIGCIDDLQREIDELKAQMIKLKQGQQSNSGSGYHDVSQFYPEEK